MTKTRVVGIIPARMGSERVLNKNFRDFAGKPLLLHTLEQAMESNVLHDVVVSTNNTAFVSSLSADIQKHFLIRPEYLCAADKPGYTYVVHALDELERTSGKRYTHFVTLPPTSPLRQSRDIDAAVKMLLEDESLDTVTSMTPVNQMYHGLKQKGVDDDGILYPYFQDEKGRTAYQDLPKLVVRNCAIYASKIEVLAYKTMIGFKCKAYLMPANRSVDINEPIDFEFAEFLHNKNLSD